MKLLIDSLHYTGWIQLWLSSHLALYSRTTLSGQIWPDRQCSVYGSTYIMRGDRSLAQLSVNRFWKDSKLLHRQGLGAR